MSDKTDIVGQLNAACVGYPTAKIPWPHRLLHDARDEINRLRARVSELETEISDMSYELRERGE